MKTMSEAVLNAHTKLHRKPDGNADDSEDGRALWRAYCFLADVEKTAGDMMTKIAIAKMMGNYPDGSS